MSIRSARAGAARHRRPAIALVALACVGTLVMLSTPRATVREATASPATFSVGATILNFCTLSAASVAFGPVSVGRATANSAARVTLLCNKGAVVTEVALDDGSNAAGAQKRMRDPVSGEFLMYMIDVPTGATFDACPASGAGPEWNASNTISATALFAASGGAKPISICASIPAGQIPAAGGYFDTVQVRAIYN